MAATREGDQRHSRPQREQEPGRWPGDEQPCQWPWSAANRYPACAYRLGGPVLSTSGEPVVVAVVAEKPAVARDIARVLGARKRGEGYLHGNGHVVTWAIGHLVALAQPHEIDPDWRRWRWESLPMLPAGWPLVVGEATREQFETVRKIITSARVGRVVCATDAGREGELIFRYIYEAARCRKPVSRLWVSSLTPEAIREGFERLRPGSELDPLADAARGRSQADWLVGMNLSRACTLAFGEALGETLSVGRVQTPTLALVVERERAIRAFVPEDYLEVEASFTPREGNPREDGATPAVYKGTWFRGEKPEPGARRLDADGVEAARVVERALAGEACIESIRAETRRQPPPPLYDLTELQRHANRLYGFSASRTLELAQQLYERGKLISYPRTDSRHLSATVAATLGAVVEAIRPPYAELLAQGTGERPLGRRFVDDTRVTDHHAIIPTTTSPAAVSLGGDEQRIYDLICRRLLAAWHDDHVTSVTTVITAIRTPPGTVGDEPVVDRYHSSGTVVEQVGWKVLEPAGRGGKKARRDGKARDDPPKLPPGLARDQAQTVLDARALAKQTRPPARFTEASLLTAMESAGKTLDDKALSEAMKETGLGTPATRAEIIETLLRRGYIERSGKALEATDRGMRLIDVVHPGVKSPAMTGQWEARLRDIQRGTGRLDAFMEEIEAYVREAVGALHSGREAAVAEIDEGAVPPPSAARGPRDPVPVERLSELLGSAFGLEAFRPHQEAVCRAVVQGQNVLLVMPTGAGKSLCYQLPGLARAGTTLVISPLIALMEDQVAKLQARDLRAERIHSGRGRQASRQACVDYLAGALDFLFIAPERLTVPGFPEMLARRRPTLIAVDEAHCISHWGHDFRHDYRLLGPRLAPLQPTPVIAMTATATPRVQDDIATQLGMARETRHIHGFRRDNIAVEVMELPPGERRDAVTRVLSDSGRRPAIVYAPSRKEADALGAALGEAFPAAAYHAGMATPERDRVQSRFLAGELEVIVATIAFGMGVDKADIRTVIHTGLPASLEGYYQEIGRAGRDGGASRAILMYSYADRRTHEFFHQRDYPPEGELWRIHEALGADAVPRQALQELLAMDPEVFATALEKLWIHGGARVDAEDGVRRGEAAWQAPYRAQSEHKHWQLDQMMRFAESHACRMLYLVRHFGDQEDSGEPCGICDVCRPADCVARRFREATAAELGLARDLLAALRRRDGLSTGQLYRQVGEGVLERRAFQRLLGGLAAAGLVRVSEDAFEKDGRTIAFQRAYLTAEGREGAPPGGGLQLAEEPPATRKRRAPARGAARTGGPRTSEGEAPAALVEALTDWRLAEARRRKVPAFRILTDRALRALAQARPGDTEGLLAIPGIGPRIVERYAEELLGLLGDAGRS